MIDNLHDNCSVHSIHGVFIQQLESLTSHLVEIPSGFSTLAKIRRCLTPGETEARRQGFEVVPGSDRGSCRL